MTICNIVGCLFLLIIFGCSESNSSAPRTDQAHPDGWYEDHGQVAVKEKNYNSCHTCHGIDLTGGGSAASCFSGSLDGLSCHAGGPGAPHPLDSSYLMGVNHGPDAKADLTVCQGCHAVPNKSGPGSNPRFNLGINSAGGNGCEACHDLNFAHPQNGWGGPAGPFHYSAGNIQNACTLCHGVSLDGTGGTGASCLGCHTSVSTFTLDCRACHGNPPDGTVDGAAPIGVDHGEVSNISLHDDCVVCHGLKESAPGGTFAAVVNYALFDNNTDMNGDHWNGRINMNADTAYNETDFGCDTAGCHDNASHQLSDSGLPVELGAYGFGGLPVPHTLDGSYLQGDSHGPDAKADLVFCQGCHGEAGGPGGNPRFNVGIINAGGTGCEACHTTNYAHPQDGWAGPDGTFHYSAGNIDEACALCHGTGLDGDGGVAVGGSCLTCHAEPVNLTLDCTYCHGLPPGETGVVLHGIVDNISAHDDCVVCHGMKESATRGSFSVVANYALFDAASDTNGAHWNGRINMNSDTEYIENNFGCDAAGCHGNDDRHQLSDSGLTVELGAYGSWGGSLPHPVDGSFLDPVHHGPAAQGDTANFPDGIVDCQNCHATPASGDKPRFNVGIYSAGDVGCEGCHNDNTAHPSGGGRDNKAWYGLTPTHSDIMTTKYVIMCTLCHGVALDGAGGVPGAGGCNDCHNADPVTNPDCVSCHNGLPTGPDGGLPAGNVRPNRAGEHATEIVDTHAYVCGVCHYGYELDKAQHYDDIEPADVDMLGRGIWDEVNRECSSVVCHDDSGVRPWY